MWPDKSGFQVPRFVGMLRVLRADLLQADVRPGSYSPAQVCVRRGLVPQTGVNAFLPLAELLLDWKQNADEIIVKLNLGSGALKVEDVDAAFTDTDCVVKLPGMGSRANIFPAGLGVAAGWMWGCSRPA